MSVPQLPFRPPVETSLIDENKQLSFAWSQHFQLTAQQLKTPANQTPPTLSNAPGQFGQIALDANGNLYAYVGTKWMKIQLLNF
jgi:hypothetical protein